MKPETERETFTLVSCSAVNTAALVSLALATVFSTTEYQVDKPFKYKQISANIFCTHTFFYILAIYDTSPFLSHSGTLISVSS